MNLFRHSPDIVHIPQELLQDLATSELALVGFFLASADHASRQCDDVFEAVALKKAFVTFCEAVVRVSQLPEANRAVLLRQIEELRQKLKAAYYDEI